MFSNFQNSGYMNPGYPQPGMQYAQRPTAKMTQPLTKEEANKLRSNGAVFDLQVSPTDMLKAICTHKDNGNIVLIDNGNGTVSCPICGETFSIMDISQTDVETATNTLLDVLQTIKTMYLDMPEEVARQFFQIIPLLRKTAKLYEISMSNFHKYEAPNAFQNQNSVYGFNALNAITNPAFGGMGMMPQPQMMPQPNMYQAQPYQPAYQPAYQQPMMGQNPFVYNAPQAPVMPTAEATPAAPATPADNNQQQAVTTQKTFNV